MAYKRLDFSPPSSLTRDALGSQARLTSKPPHFTRKAIALSAALLFCSGWGQAAELGLEAALRVAVAEHPSVAARQSELRAAVLKMDLAERQQYPGLVAQSAQDALGKQVTTLRLEQPLWTGGRITAELGSAQASINQAEAGVLQAQQDIMLKVVTSFTELGRIQARQLAAKSNVEEHIRLDNMIQRRVESQVSPASDGVQANARLAQARAELSQLEALASRARSALSQATGSVVTDISLPEQRGMDAYTLDGLVSAAIDFSPALRKLEGEYESATAEMAIRKSGAYPQLKARVDRTFGGASAGTNAYLALDVQTGAGFSTIASVREAEARREAVQSQIEVIRRETIDAVSADHADLLSLGKQAKDLRSQVDSTTSVFDSFVRQYAVGRKGWNDVLNAQREVTQARYQLADAVWGTLRSALRLQLLTGLMTADNITLIVDPARAVLAASSPKTTTVNAPATPVDSMTSAVVTAAPDSATAIRSTALSPWAEKAATAVAPEATTGTATETTPEATTGAATAIAPEATTGAATAVVPEATTGAATAVVPEATTGAATAVAPKATIGAATAVVPEATTGAATAVVPEATIGAATAVVPEPTIGAATAAASEMVSFTQQHPAEIALAGTPETSARGAN